MLTNFFVRPLELRVGEQIYKFYSTSDFEFSLHGRTTVPASTFRELTHYSQDQLRGEAYAIKELEETLLEILSRSIDSPDTIRRGMKNFHHQEFSQDHNWRNIFLSLLSDNGKSEMLLRIALAKYIQYLISRKEIINMLHRLNLS